MAVWPPGWTILPMLPGAQEGAAYNISTDGQTIVGFTDDPLLGGGSRRSCYWTPDSGPIIISQPADSSPYGSAANAVSGDGSLIVGQAGLGTYYWTAATGRVILDVVSSVYAMSADGRRFTGADYTGPFANQICYWDVPGFTKTHIPLFPGFAGADPYAISHDGSVIVGTLYSGSNPAQTEVPFRWTAATGIVPIDIGSAQWARAFSVSGDGTIVIGDIFDPTITPAYLQHGSFTWTQAGGLVVIPPEDPDQNHGVYGYYAISDDGSTIQSYGWWPNLDNDGGNHIALTRGTQRFIPKPIRIDPTSTLADQGMYPSGLSHDGSIMTGYGDNGISFANVSPWVFRAAAITLIDSELLLVTSASFTDLAVEANRRLFISPEGTPTWMGVSGQLPSGETPPIYLTTLGPPPNFAQNNGNGGAFIPSGPIGPHDGPGCTDYVVGEGAGVGGGPMWRLSYSDNGARTWSPLVKPRAIGTAGRYTTRLRWLKMGQFRQRSIKLECTDPIRRNIIGVYVDTSEGMG